MRDHLSKHLDAAERKLKAAQDAITELRKAIERLDIAEENVDIAEANVDDEKQKQLLRVIPKILKKYNKTKYNQVQNKNGFVFGDRVTISWDRRVNVFSGRKGSPTKKEGKTGYIVGHTNEYVYVVLEPIENLEVVQKKSHNITLEKTTVV
jgi:hypothetical protein